MSTGGGSGGGTGSGGGVSISSAAAAALSNTAIHDFNEIPVIDLAPMFGVDPKQKQAVAAELFRACRSVGFFYVKNHGISKQLIARLFSEGKRFFSLPVEVKNKIHMKQSDCYRGYFMLGEELTSKKKDWKEGLYFGAECGLDHPSVKAKIPMHGPNQWPDATDFPGFDRLIIDYMDACTELGHTIMTGIAMGLGIESDYFRSRFTKEPFTPFRLFWYPTDLSPDEQERMQKMSDANSGKPAAPPVTTDSKTAEGKTAAPTAAATPAPAAVEAKTKAAGSGGGGGGGGYGGDRPADGGDGKWGVGAHTDCKSQHISYNCHCHSQAFTLCCCRRLLDGCWVVHRWCTDDIGTGRNRWFGG